MDAKASDFKVFCGDTIEVNNEVFVVVKEQQVVFESAFWLPLQVCLYLDYEVKIIK